MEENLEYIDEFFLVHLLVVNMMDDNAWHHELKIAYPMDQVVMEAKDNKINFKKFN
jgi:hypothetical protein